MYKKLIIALVAILTLGVGDACAQSANRNGFYLDLTVGSNLGYIYKGREEYRNSNGDYVYTPYMYAKNGVEAALGFGYRLKMSRHWAWDFRLNLQENLYKTNYFLLGILPVGIRYTSSDFGNTGRSFFCSLNTGFNIAPTYSDVGFGMPFEITMGLNLTRKLYLALVGQYRLLILGEDYLATGIRDYNGYEVHTWARLKSNGFIGARVGYRF